MSLLGHLTIAGLDEFGIDQVFIGAFGIDPEIGVTGTNLGETQTDRSLISSAPGSSSCSPTSSQARPARPGPARADRALSPRSSPTSGADPAVLDAFRAAGVNVETC